jgi:tetratricopeptide (TPR) repeat protein
MTTLTVAGAEAMSSRRTELVLAHAHLVLGSHALARSELEALFGLGLLDPQALADLAEVRWRTGDLTGAGEAASAALLDDAEYPVALVIAAEAAAALGRPSEARRLALRAMACATGSIDSIFAGMPRSAVWPADADEPPPTAPTLFDRAPQPGGRPSGRPEGGGSRAGDAVAGRAPAQVAPIPVTRGFWDEDGPETPDEEEQPDPAAELERGRAALVAGRLDEAVLRLGIALRLAPALAPAILEATAGARSPSLVIVRGDAYRLAGHEAEAREAYLVAAQGGLPERRGAARSGPSLADPADLDDPEAASDDAGADQPPA